MCLGVPGQVVEPVQGEEAMATAIVDFSGLRRRICMSCVPEAKVGDYVIVHAGIAISQIDPEEAVKVFTYLEELGELADFQEDQSLDRAVKPDLTDPS